MKMNSKIMQEFDFIEVREKKNFIFIFYLIIIEKKTSTMKKGTEGKFTMDGI